MSITGAPESAPLRVGYPVCDTLGGLFGAFPLGYAVILPVLKALTPAARAQAIGREVVVSLIEGSVQVERMARAGHPPLDELSPEAQAMGAVNTVIHRAGRLVGVLNWTAGLPHPYAGQGLTASTAVFLGGALYVLGGARDGTEDLQVRARPDLRKRHSR